MKKVVLCLTGLRKLQASHFTFVFLQLIVNENHTYACTSDA